MRESKVQCGTARSVKLWSVTKRPREAKQPVTRRENQSARTFGKRLKKKRGDGGIKLNERNDKFREERKRESERLGEF